MRPGVLIFGVIIFILSAAFFYIPKVTATPADLGAIEPAATLSKYWAAGGMVIGAAIIIYASLMHKRFVDPKKSPMQEYPRTSAGQDDSGTDFFP
jgi:hypothetical protein